MLNIAPIHVIGLLISVGLFYQSVNLVRKRKESVFEFLLWSGFGVVLLLLSLGSSVTVVGALDLISEVLALLGFRSGTNGIFVLSILALLLMLFYTYVNAKNNRKEIYDLNQQIALLRYEQNKPGAKKEVDAESDHQ